MQPKRQVLRGEGQGITQGLQTIFSHDGLLEVHHHYEVEPVGLPVLGCLITYCCGPWEAVAVVRWLAFMPALYLNYLLTALVVA
jgi:hypothetical protein